VALSLRIERERDEVVAMKTSPRSSSTDIGAQTFGVPNAYPASLTSPVA
jgi:hypothetical protein